MANVECIYHLAGPTAGLIRSSPAEACSNQIVGTFNILDAMVHHKVKRFVLASSFYVYEGITEESSVNEKTPLPGLTMGIFGLSKVMAERAVHVYAQRYGIEAVILRFGSAYGPGSSSNAIGEFVRDGLKQQGIQVWGKGNRKNQYTHVDDLVAGMNLALNCSPMTLNLISPQITTTLDLAQLLSSEFGFQFSMLPDRVEAPSFPYMSSHAAQRLDWTPRKLEDAIHQVVDAAQAEIKAAAIDEPQTC